MLTWFWLVFKIGDVLLLKLENWRVWPEIIEDVKSALPAAVISLSGPLFSSFVKGDLVRCSLATPKDL